ncbi:MAG: hypothetical protein KC420_03665, partial [Myxococcales bacterium]|nr:hypothetical protein [Myxococcales bacterium]
MRGAGCMLIAALTVACNGGEGESEDGSATATATTTASTSTSAATATTSAGGSESATGSGGESDSSASTSASGSASASTSAGETSGGVTTTDTSTGDPGNSPPMFVSEPELEIVLTELYKSNFNPGEAFIASSRTDEIRVYDADTLAYITSFNHPAFSEINSPSYQYGP